MAKDSSGDILEKNRQKAAGLQEQGYELYPNHFTVRHTVADIRRQVDDPDIRISETEPVYTVAGRIMAINRFGKTSFIRFRDRSGQLQAYIRRDRIGNDEYGFFKQLDIGDFIGLVGPVFKTRTGEWTLLVDSVTLLAKAIRPLPEKFHGLRDPEKRYRQRYIDLLMNAEVREIFVQRSRIIQAFREFFRRHDYLEVETPMMQPIPGGAEAAPFKTFHNALGMDLYLRIAPELYLKRLVVGGFERVFEINRNFRNEGVSSQHNPEFTMLEFYQAYATYEDLMDVTEKLLAEVAEAAVGSTSVQYQGQTIELGGRWQRMTLSGALESIGGLDPGLLGDREQLLAFAARRNVQITKTGRIGKIVTKLFDALVEPELIQPTFITGYPVEVSPLSRRSDKHPELTDRFELFIGGREIANGFSELNDPSDQKDRFLQQLARRKEGDEEAHWMDEDYIEALEYGMPPTAGEGIGIDRVVMLLTDAASIREVILFPHMKRIEKI